MSLVIINQVGDATLLVCSVRDIIDEDLFLQGVWTVFRRPGVLLGPEYCRS